MQFRYKKNMSSQLLVAFFTLSLQLLLPYGSDTCVVYVLVLVNPLTQVKLLAFGYYPNFWFVGTALTAPALLNHFHGVLGITLSPSDA